jgi:hypothetical protein
VSAKSTTRRCDCGREFRPRSRHQFVCSTCLRPKGCECEVPILANDDLLGGHCVKCAGRLVPTDDVPAEAEEEEYPRV